MSDPIWTIAAASVAGSMLTVAVGIRCRRAIRRRIGLLVFGLAFTLLGKPLSVVFCPRCVGAVDALCVECLPSQGTTPQSLTGAG